MGLESNRNILANPICKHIAKATQADAPTKALSKSLQMPALITAFHDGLRLGHAQKNKINLCFVDRLVQIENDKKKAK
jgi:hypothetical protein